jgi:hypothetical protein
VSNCRSILQLYSTRSDRTWDYHDCTEDLEQKQFSDCVYLGREWLYTNGTGTPRAGAPDRPFTSTTKAYNHHTSGGITDTTAIIATVLLLRKHRKSLLLKGVELGRPGPRTKYRHRVQSITGYLASLLNEALFIAEVNYFGKVPSIPDSCTPCCASHSRLNAGRLINYNRICFLLTLLQTTFRILSPILSKYFQYHLHVLPFEAMDCAQSIPHWWLDQLGLD